MNYVSAIALYVYFQVIRRLPIVFGIVWTLPWIFYTFMYVLSDIVDGNCIIWVNVHTTTQRVLILTSGIICLSLGPSVIISYLYAKMTMAITFGSKAHAKDSKNVPISKAQLNITMLCYYVMLLCYVIMLCYCCSDLIS